MSVSYKKDVRDKAAREQKGLFTIDLINANKTPGKFGSRMTMSGPADEADYKAISDFLLEFIKRRNQKKAEGG